ncbi:hypothetical protein TRFO_19442 [Tritrichomonas foetus]|uniref:Uncharacterized protein n=1 Tax=Tritrichomonas foetus TaxID=1144522 RepID=A0A1J4KIX9_9EUKA|nr:hypothetical protein TRFO_19442 [Tritrichomonas foetus]|eukprot:OHT11042.1 hypothetical protein TRFO_19442 [Tritrichomonas foetus]
MNVTINFLLISSLIRTNSPLFNSIHHLNLQKSTFSHFLSPSIFNPRHLHIQKSKFLFFQNTPIIVQKSFPSLSDDTNDNINGEYFTGYLETPLRITENETVVIEQATFFKCVATRNHGGAIFYSNMKGTVKINHTIFQQCTSFLKGGAVHFTGNDFNMECVSFFSCSATTSQAADFTGEIISSNYGVCIFKCGDSIDCRPGPTVRVTSKNSNWDSVAFEYLNMSYNTIKNYDLCGLIIIENSGDFELLFNTIFENECGSAVQSDNNYLMITKSNLVQNHLTDSVFIGLNTAYLYIEECFIGHDYHAPFVPPASPAPTETPMQTLPPPPTAPPPPSFNIVKILGDLSISEEELRKLQDLQKSQISKLNLEQAKKYSQRFAHKYSKQLTRKLNNQVKHLTKIYRNYQLSEEKEILLGILDDTFAMIYFSDCKIDYGNENNFIMCDDQCYISDFETYNITEFYLEQFTQDVPAPTDTKVEAFGFPTSYGAIGMVAIVCVVVMFLIVLLTFNRCSNIAKIKVSTEIQEEFHGENREKNNNLISHP